MILQVVIKTWGINVFIMDYKNMDYNNYHIFYVFIINKLP